MIQAIKYLYTYWPDRQIDDKVRDQYIYVSDLILEFLRDVSIERLFQMCTDAYYTAPVGLAAQMRSEAGSIVYMYVNSYNFSTGALNPSQYFLPYWMGKSNFGLSLNRLDDGWSLAGVCHECDLMLLFGFPWMPRHLIPAHLRNVQWTDYDKNMSEVFMAMWQQFAKKKSVPSGVARRPGSHPGEVQQLTEASAFSEIQTFRAIISGSTMHHVIIGIWI